jgi:hypothetical protein
VMVDVWTAAAASAPMLGNLRRALAMQDRGEP